jgi:hypothetical protein
MAVSEFHSLLIGGIRAALPSIVDNLDLGDLRPECLIDFCHAQDCIGVQALDLLQKSPSFIVTVSLRVTTSRRHTGPEAASGSDVCCFLYEFSRHSWRLGT